MNIALNIIGLWFFKGDSVDKGTIKTIIAEQAEEIEERRKKEHIIPREIKAGNYLAPNIALFILGVRRCGKSTLASQLFRGGTFGYINFDDERLIGLTRSDLNTVLQAFYELYGSNLHDFVFDEIQSVKGWELFASRLRETKRVIITGSNSKLLSGELATYMTGRHIDITLFPFSFTEYIKYKGAQFGDVLTTKERAAINNMLDEYLKNGGFPEFFKYGRAAIDGIYNDIIARDIAQRHGIKHVDALRQVAKYLVSNSSQEFTYSSLRNISRSKSVITVTNWVRYMEEAYLIFKIERFSFKLKDIAIAPKKVYAIDTGIVSVLGFRSDENIARLMETAVAIELRRRQQEHKDEEVYYWKDHQQREVDFVIKRENKVMQLIQVTYASSRSEIKSREIENLKSAGGELRCNNLRVITKDYEGKERMANKTIEFIPVWKWLLAH